jgi:hypothetical protein
LEISFHEDIRNDRTSPDAKNQSCSLSLDNLELFQLGTTQAWIPNRGSIFQLAPNEANVGNSEVSLGCTPKRVRHSSEESDAMEACRFDFSDVVLHRESTIEVDAKYLDVLRRIGGCEDDRTKGNRRPWSFGAHGEKEGVTFLGGKDHIVVAQPRAKETVINLRQFGREEVNIIAGDPQR